MAGKQRGIAFFSLHLLPSGAASGVRAVHFVSQAVFSACATSPTPPTTPCTPLHPLHPCLFAEAMLQLCDGTHAAMLLPDPGCTDPSPTIVHCSLAAVAGRSFGGDITVPDHAFSAAGFAVIGGCVVGGLITVGAGGQRQFAVRARVWMRPRLALSCTPNHPALTVAPAPIVLAFPPPPPP